MRLKTLLSITLLALTVTSCNSVDPKTPTDKYFLSVDCRDSGLVSNLPQEGWYKKGTKFSFKIAHVTDVSRYAYLGEDRLSSVKEDSGYSHYEFKMPGNGITLGIGNQYYVDRDYSINEFNPVTFNKEDILMVEIETGAVKPSVDDSHRTVRSVDERDIEYNYSLFNIKQMVKTDIQTADGVFMKVIFDLESDRKETFYFENDIIISADFSERQRFTFNSNASKPKISHPLEPTDR